MCAWLWVRVIDVHPPGHGRVQVLCDNAAAISAAAQDGAQPAAAATAAPAAAVAPSTSAAGPAKPEPGATGAKGAAASGPAGIEMETSANGETLFKLGGTKFATISTFKGKSLVNLREFYQKDGAWLPGKKVCSYKLV
jgi:Transcriptional Coactivator p15 (PC4)